MGTYFYFHIVGEELRHKKEFYSQIHKNFNGIASVNMRLVINLTLKVVFN